MSPEPEGKYTELIEAVIFVVVAAFIVAAVLGQALNSLGDTSALSTAGATVIAVYGLLGIIVVVVIVLLFMKLAR